MPDTRRIEPHLKVQQPTDPPPKVRQVSGSNPSFHHQLDFEEQGFLQIPRWILRHSPDILFAGFKIQITWKVGDITGMSSGV
jgi:hypothetical protein